METSLNPFNPMNKIVTSEANGSHLPDLVSVTIYWEEMEAGRPGISDHGLIPHLHPRPPSHLYFNTA